ncbi:sodium/hydrogen exchanger 7-like isoform X4 [Carya illinoinensis]|uniref:sodium/hydrogen exchanger 7-like isoform X4 n=1 Tax=Carya illinoinensis TaxID=32201 RepID=UPI001C71C4CE|nr:sodium/hydrogen exchanger 7-like isoform X4 [Carya illinoinensis]
MAGLTEVLLPYRIMEQDASSSSSHSSPTDAVSFFGLCLVLGIACRHLLRGTRVPYTLALLILGIGLGSIEYGTHHRLGKIGDGIRLWANIDPDLLLAVFLPALLFESSFSMEVHQIKRCLAQMIFLAGPGVLISTFCLGSALKFTFLYDWSWKTSLLLGGLLSATDPVAVVALLKDLGASKKLTTIIEGESMMNDGTAIVVYQLFYQMVLGKSFNWTAIIKFLTKVSVGAVGIGLAFGIISVLWLGVIFNDTVIEITLTLAVSYIAYFIGQEGVDVSGILTVMTLGMFYAAFAKTAFKGDGQKSLHHFCGVIIAEGILDGDDNFKNALPVLVGLHLLVQFVFSVQFWVQLPWFADLGSFIFQRFLALLETQFSASIKILRCNSGGEYMFNEFQAFLQSKGIISQRTCPSIREQNSVVERKNRHLLDVRASDSSTVLDSKTGTLFVFFTGGIVLLTLIVNGSTTQFILSLLHMDKLLAAKHRKLGYTKYEMLNKAIEAFGELGDDEELGPADWPTVKRYITSLNNLEGESVHPIGASEDDDNNLYPANLNDIRIRMLNGVQAAYWVMLDEGRITQTTANLLMQSVDEALDLVSHEPLCDWNGLKTNVKFPSYYKLLQVGFVPQKLALYLTVERLESACYICAAFLRAHRMARWQLHDLLGESDVASIVIKESEAEGQEARKFLEDVRAAFPQVLRVVKTRQVTHSVLNHLIDYIQNCEKIGLLEEKEMLHLHDAVQTDFKKLLRCPPLVKIPKMSDLISVHPLFGALPSSVSAPLQGSTQETVKLCGLTLYKEGFKPNGIWLISNGVVKWTIKSIKNKHSLHPAFTHGSTLGLYEVLSGKSNICDMITDSVVLCFFVEREKILSVLSLDPSLEDFLWQESAIVLVKLLLPQIFEKIALQDLRALVSERSIMKLYIRGETIEVPQHSIGFLLEGFIKIQGAEELVASPAALLPSHGSLIFESLKSSGITGASFSYQGSRYQVETRARVIIFDMAAFEADCTLQRSSWISPSADRPHRSLGREPRGLMSWPENFYNPRQHNQIPEGIDRQANSLSAKAMHLSIYGSMVKYQMVH